MPNRKTIIDFRLRPPFKGFRMLNRFSKERVIWWRSVLGFSMSESFYSDSLDLIFKEMDEAGISKGVIIGIKNGPVLGEVSNDEISEVVEKYPEKFIGIGALDLSNRGKALLEAERIVKDLNLKGISFEPGRAAQGALHANDKCLYPIYQKCEALNVPLILNISEVIGPDISYCNPTAVDEVARDFPTLKIIISHGCWPWVLQVLGVAMKRENIYLAPDVYALNMPGANFFIEAASTFLQERYLFSTAYPFAHLKEAVDKFKSWQIKEDVLQKLLYKNAEKMLGI